MNKKLMLKCVEILGVLSCIIAFIGQIFLNIDFRICNFILLGYMGIFLLALAYYREDNKTSELFYKNKMLLMYAELAKISLLIGMNIEFHFKGVSQAAFGIQMIICLVFIIWDINKFLKNSEGEKYITHMQITYLIAYLFAMGNVRNYWILFTSIPIFIVTAIFNNSIWLKINYVMVQVMTFLVSCRHVIYVYNNDKYYLGVYFITNILIGFFCLTVMRTISVNERTNNEKMEAINEKKNVVTSMANNLIAMGEKIKNNSSELNGEIRDIDVSTNNAIIIFEDIKAGNDMNLVSINKQTEMIKNIMNLIENVNLGVKHVIFSIKEAYAGLEKSIISISELKKKSEIIIERNQEVINVINEFKDNISQMSNTVSEISNISEQTSLLSLNASIESARAGEKGKGFAVVASEITSLSEETEDMTRDVRIMVSKLEESVITANLYLKNVISSIEGEDIIFGKNLENIEKIKISILKLEDTIIKVLKKMQSIINISDFIETYSVEMDDLSKKITSDIIKVVELSEDNRRNASKTKDFLEEMNTVVNKLDACV